MTVEMVASGSPATTSREALIRIAPPQDGSVKLPASIKLKRLGQTHPRLDVMKTRVLRALFRGGRHLLGNMDILHRVFPSYTYETPHVYTERKSRAFYENMFGLVITQISAALAQDPARIDSKQDDAVAASSVVDPYWSSIMENATPLSEDGSTTRSMDQVLRDAAIEAMITGWSWLQSDLPGSSESGEDQSLADQEKSGALRAYVVSWLTEQVTDWEEKRGRLLWVRTYQCEVDATDPGADRDTERHTWTIWTDREWGRYVVTRAKNQAMPGPEEEVMLADSGTHSFGRVPWIRLDLANSGLHLGDVLESVCTAYFNRQNGESFQWTQFYYQQLYEFLGAELSGIDTPVSTAQQDNARAHRRRAPGVVHVRGADDRAEFIGPNMTGADVGAKALADLRDAIFRTTAQMALSQDTSGAMLRRSGDSKAQDNRAGEILIGAVGARLLVAARHLMTLLANGRGDVEEPPRLSGYQDFDITDADAKLNRAVLIEQVNIPSATFQIEEKYQIAVEFLGESVSAETRQKIRQDLEKTVTQDQLILQNTFVPPPPPTPPGEEPDDPSNPGEEK